LQSVIRDLGHWFWRLVPANPILVRVVYAGGRRLQHLWIRIGYLGILAFAVVIGVLFVSRQGGSSLSELAKSATVVFQALSVIQLLMVCVLAPIFTSAAITQEKNSQTFNILLSTPLTNGQIVLGSLLSRLYFVFMLLLAGIPLFCILMVYGGVTGDKILLSIGIAGGTAMLTGSIAIAISVIRIGTGRTIFSFYLAIAMYLIIVYALSSAAAFIPPESQPAPGKGTGSLMSWMAAFHPFLSLSVVLGQTPAPDFGSVAHYGFPRNLWLAHPQYSFIAMTVLFSIVLVSLSLFFVRHGSKEGEDSIWNRMFARKKPETDGAELTRKPRTVQKNPITWRESKTGAAAGGGRLMRWSIYIVGAIVAILTLISHARGWLLISQTRNLLFGIVAVELFIALFIATATSATSMTREKESNTLELVLATPLTSKQIISGKIWGLVWAAGPMLAVPYATVALMAIFGLFHRGPGGPVVYWQSLLSLPGLFLGFAGVACMIGLWASIKNKKTLGAVFKSMALVIGLFGLPSLCIFGIRSADNAGLTAAFMSISPLTATWVALDPEGAVSEAATATKLTPAELMVCLNSSLIASLCTAGICYVVILGLNKTMVHNFDMTIRKQSA
jgi:ABC-type transport system involved in multi-copper enzyme maturation permease subunit